MGNTNSFTLTVHARDARQIELQAKRMKEELNRVKAMHLNFTRNIEKIGFSWKFIIVFLLY